MLPTGVMVLFHLQLVTLLLDRANQPTIGAAGGFVKPHYQNWGNTDSIGSNTQYNNCTLAH
jgi:hypothetical protein